METAVILTNDRFLSGKTPLPFYHPKHCRKITKSTVIKELKDLTMRKMMLCLEGERSTAQRQYQKAKHHNINMHGDCVAAAMD